MLSWRVKGFELFWMLIKTFRPGFVHLLGDFWLHCLITHGHVVVRHFFGG